jgi:hypothetical protein
MTIFVNGVDISGGGASLPTDDPSSLLEDPASPDRFFTTNVAGNGSLATAAEARALLGARIIDPLTSTGWTTATDSGSGTVTWATAPARLSFAIPPSTDGLLSALRAAYIPEADEWDVVARVDITAGDGANNTRVILQAGVDANNLYALALYADGTLEPGRTVGGAYTSGGTAAGPDSGQRTGGQLWMRLSRRVTGVVASWGVGAAGALPVTWATVVTPDTSAAGLTATCGTYVRIIHTTFGGGVVAGFSADVLAIRLTGQSGGAL